MNNTQYPFLVYISCATYNHVHYVEDALNGFCMQQTDFPFLAMVMDDASTDGEQEVINRYLEQNFDLSDLSIESETNSDIRDHAWRCETEEGVYTFAQHKENKSCYVLSVNLKKNLYKSGKKGTLVKPWREMTKYIALCEGDDYWTDPLKLQKQVDILEKDETLMACVTNCSVVDNNGKTIKDVRGGVVKNDIEGRYNLRDFFNNNHQYPTLSAVYRNSHPKEVGEKTRIMSNPYLGDWTLWIALHCFGDFYFLNEATCAYRINPTSLTHSNSIKRRIGLAKENFRLLPAVASVLPEGFEDIQKNLRENTAWMWLDLGRAYFKARMYSKAFECMYRYGLKNLSDLFKPKIKK